MVDESPAEYRHIFTKIRDVVRCSGFMPQIITGLPINAPILYGQDIRLITIPTANALRVVD